MNNLQVIESFLEDKINTTMILPKVSSEIIIFYQILLKEICKNKNFLCRKIDNYENIGELITPTLFEERNSYIVDINSVKNSLENLTEIDDKSQKFFVFVNYASYKKNLTRSIQLNAYDYKKDMSAILEKEQVFCSLEDKIKIDFLSFSYDNPHLFFSELQKSQVQTQIFSRDKSHYDDTILSVRKDIFRYKNDFSIRILSKLYSLFKKEIRIKKFNF
mgnify:CR=1 FL=1|tara:strand:- start:1285 stop:1938 length:654 start_codon:yes stop_codon:yes gene_type:complete